MASACRQRCNSVILEYMCCWKLLSYIDPDAALLRLGFTGFGLWWCWCLPVLVGPWTPAGLSLPVSLPVNLSTEKKKRWRGLTDSVYIPRHSFVFRRVECVHKWTVRHHDAAWRNLAKSKSTQLHNAVP